MTTRLELPQRTQQKLEGFRKRVWKIKLIEGVCAALFGLIFTYNLVYFFDRFMDTPAWLRFLLLLVGSAGPGILLPLKLHRWVWQTRRLDQLARLLKHRMPRLSDRLLGIIELAQSDVEQGRSAALCQAALRQVDGDIEHTDLRDAVPNPRHRRWLRALAVPATVASVGMLLSPAAGWSAAKRWLTPWGNTPRFTFTQLEQLRDRMYVPYGEAFSVSANLTPESAWQPETGVASIDQQPAVETPRVEARYDFEIAPQQQDTTLSLTVGDAQKSIAIEPKRRPELKEITAQIRLPDYLQYTNPQTRDVRAGTLTVVEGSQAELYASASRALTTATLDGNPETVTAEQIRTRPIRLETSRTLQLHWTDEFELTPREPFSLKVAAMPDQPPSVTCSELARQQIVLVDQVLSFEVTADDDFGVRQIGIEWQGLQDPLTNPHPDSGHTMISAGAPESTSLVTQATFCAARENIAPQTLHVRLFAVDYLPGRERIYSPPYTLFVLSSQQHANWLSERLKNWSRKAQGVYEREVQLFEENKAIRQIPTTQLAQQATRQRIETQAAAENMNARQLNALTTSGKQLIQEAAKNNQFNVATMEGLAEMVTTLDNLAKNRMPSVADLLKQAASAQGPNPSTKDLSDSDSKDDQKAPKVGNNRDSGRQSGSSKSTADEKKQDDKPTKPTPAIIDVESSLGQDDETEEKSAKDQPPSPGSPPKFGLPSTTVYGKADEPDSAAPSEMEEALEQAIAAQDSLLEEFTAVAEELQRILDNLEGSTFVKRLKAASRRQTEVARQLNNGLTNKFARLKSQLSTPLQDSTVEIVQRENAEKSNVLTIKSDLEAYYQRVQEGKFGTVIREMDELQVLSQLGSLSDLVADNLHGQSIAHAEFWADTFDRWAEQLVGPG